MDGLTSAEGLARHVVQTMAADELPLFDENVLAARRTGASGSSRDTLGIGIEATAVLSPLIIALAKVAVGAAWGMVSPEFARRTAGPLARLRAGIRAVPVLRRFVPEEKDPAGLPKLTAEQLQELRKLIEGRARALGTSPDKASLLAEAIAGRLAIAQP